MFCGVNVVFCSGFDVMVFVVVGIFVLLLVGVVGSVVFVVVLR